MMKKNDKKLCWGCDANVPLHFEECPFCGVNLQSEPKKEENVAATNIPTDWNTEGSENALDEKQTPNGKSEIGALLLLLPGIVFFLFGLAIILFSKEGLLTLEWNHNFAYLYLLGALPLLFLGYRSLK